MWIVGTLFSAFWLHSESKTVRLRQKFTDTVFISSYRHSLSRILSHSRFFQPFSLSLYHVVFANFCKCLCMNKLYNVYVRTNSSPFLHHSSFISHFYRQSELISNITNVFILFRFPVLSFSLSLFIYSYLFISVPLSALCTVNRMKSGHTIYSLSV